MTFRLHILFIILIIMLPIPLCAQRVRNVSGEYTFYAEGNQSTNEAKRLALEGARLQAIAAEFGTVVTQSTVQEESLSDGSEHSYFSQLSASEVKGEWLEDSGDPEYDISFIQEMLVVKCRVRGRARELSNEAADFSATILKNGTEARFADVNFHNGDDMFLLFRSPADGYVAVYLVDAAQNAYCLLPYMGNASGQQAVRHNREYVFFSSAHSNEKESVDEFTLTCDNGVERNQVYVIFSPQPFTKALDERIDAGLPRQLEFEKFSKWLTSCRRRDPRMGVKVMHIEIKE